MTDFSGLGGSVNDIFSGVGGLLQAGAYGDSAAISEKNAHLTELSTDIQMSQKRREAYSLFGATEAATAANGFSLSGSALDVLRSNRQQSALDATLTEAQGQIEKNSWDQKAASERASAQAAEIGGIGNIIGGAIGLFSDMRLKDVLGMDGVHSPGINFYRFRFKGDDQIWRGVLAQEVAKARPDAVALNDNGYLTVNYEMLGLAGMTHA